MGGVAWTGEEDDLLKKCIKRYGEGKWHRVPLLAGLNRCRKSCRLRWLNYLRPNIKRGSFAEEEVLLIIKLHKIFGNRWSLIARRLPGRTGNDVKNYWNCHLRKRLNAEETAEEDQINTMNVEIIRSQPRHAAAATPCAMKLPSTPPDCNIAAISQIQPTIEEISCSMSSSSMKPPPPFRQEITVKEDQLDSSQLGVDHGIFVGDLGTEFGRFDEATANVLSSRTDDHEGCSKWDWEDFLLDVDLWTN